MSVGDSALLMFYTQSIERQGGGGQTWTHMSSVTGPLVAGFVRKQSIRRYKLELDMWKSLCKAGPHVDWGPAHCAGQVKKTSVFVGRKHFDPGEAAAQMDRPGLRVGLAATQGWAHIKTYFTSQMISFCGYRLQHDQMFATSDQIS